MADNAAGAATVMAGIGDRLGLFKALAEAPATSAELAERAHINERYAREWLNEMTCAGYLEHDPASQRFTLPPEHVPVLAQEGGPLEQAEEAFEPIRSNIPPAMDFAGPIPWPTLQSLFDEIASPGLQWYWKTDFFTDLSDKAIELHIKYATQLPTLLSGMHLYPINGAVHRVGPEETAFSFRDANFAGVILAVDPDPANNERMIGWARDYWMALHPYSAGGGYINMMMDEGPDQVKAAYRDNYARQTQIKAKYDPHNLFHVNQNIKPTR
jgi:hypothetical protein